MNFTRIRKLYEHSQSWLLIASAIVGMSVSIVSLFGWLPKTTTLENIIVGILGIICFNLAFERHFAMRRIEHSIDAIDATRFASLTPAARELAINGISHFSAIHELLKNLGKGNSDFRGIVTELLTEQASLLKNLSEAHIAVPEEQIPLMHSKLASRYQERLDAVSNCDLHFWTSGTPLAEAYFDIGTQAVIKWNTKITRIFIFPLHDIETRHQEIAEVLLRQSEAGFEWGVAIYDFLDPRLKSHNRDLDHALFNGGQAVSFFRMRRDFEVIFRVDQNTEKVRKQIELFRDLIAECWLVSASFETHIVGSLPSEMLDEALRKGRENNRKLSKRVGHEAPEHASFTLTTADTDSIHESLIELKDIVAKYKRTKGVTPDSPRQNSTNNQKQKSRAKPRRP